MTSYSLSRRSLLCGGAAAMAWLGLGHKARAATLSIQVHKLRIISPEPNVYHGWPTVARRKNGQLLLVYSGGREGHVCPFGRVEMMTSDDEGKTWTWPRVLLDSATDDRDAGVLETAKGTILVTTFSSLAYEEYALNKALAKPQTWPADRLQHWVAARDRLTAEQRQAELGQWMIRSTDGGLTFSARYGCTVNSPHGPIQLSDGRLLYAGKELWTGSKRVGVCESADDGQTWRWLAEIPTRPGDNAQEYHELHAVEAGGGRIVVQIRNHNKPEAGHTLQCESTDGGKSWSVPRPITFGVPSHLLRLRDGRLLMTYGHRRAPLGNQARISEDGGRSWSEPVVISGDGITGDLGYPSTVELGDGSLLTVWYEVMKGSPNAALRQAHWVIKS